MKERLEKILSLEKEGWKFSQTGVVGGVQTFHAKKGNVHLQNTDWDFLLNKIQ
jgi:hypothetical protein